MDYKKLADLLYPYAKDYKEFEKKYPPRKTKGEVTRFAPSPTGFLHMGSFFQILINNRIAKSTDGTFFVRFEDTDKKREIEGAKDIILSVMQVFGMDYDEGPTFGDGNGFKGEYGPYVQSLRLDIYEAYAKKLVAEGKAFPCFCKKSEGKEDVEKRREEELKETNTISDKDPCRDLSYEEVQKQILKGKPFALKLRSMGDGIEKMIFSEELRGDRELPKNAKDVVLIKSNGLPVYAFAHAVDDHLMRTTLVVRGEEWFSSLPAHVEIFEALGFEKVKYVHTPVLCKVTQDGGKRKLSKREDKEADMRFFVSEGYPKEAVIEYLLNLANSNFELWRMENPDKNNADFKFDYKKMGTSSPIFDLVKLNDVSKEVMSRMSAEEFYNHLLKWAKYHDTKFASNLLANRGKAIRILSIDRYTKKPRKDLYKWSMVPKYYDYLFGKVSSYETEDINLEDALSLCKAYAKVYDSKDDKETWFNKIKTIAEKEGFATDNKLFKENPSAYKGNTAKACEYIRIALTGRKNSPDLYEIAKVLGDDEVKKRLMEFKG